MASIWAAAALAGAVLSGTACRPAAPPGLDAEMASCVPSDTLALAGVNLARLRASPIYQSLGSGLPAMLDSFRDASSVLAAYNGKDLLLIARGSFQKAPAGAVLLHSRLALAGAASEVRAATAQRARGKTGAPALVAQAGSLASEPIWAVARGGVRYPLSGNLANLNRLLGFTNYASFTANLDSGLSLRAYGVCASADAAQHLEETLRGMISLASATVRDRDLAALLGSTQLHRDGATMQASLQVGPGTVAKLLSAALR